MSARGGKWFPLLSVCIHEQGLRAIPGSCVTCMGLGIKIHWCFVSFLESYSELSGIISSVNYNEAEVFVCIEDGDQSVRCLSCPPPTTSKTQYHFKQASWEVGEGLHPISFPYCAADVPTGTTAQCEAVRFPKEFS